MISDVCRDTIGECFARQNGKCGCLRNTKFKNGCPFKKPDREVSNGKRYPGYGTVPSKGK